MTTTAIGAQPAVLKSSIIPETLVDHDPAKAQASGELAVKVQSAGRLSSLRNANCAARRQERPSTEEGTCPKETMQTAASLRLSILNPDVVRRLQERRDHETPTPQPDKRGRRIDRLSKLGTC